MFLWCISKILHGITSQKTVLFINILLSEGHPWPHLQYIMLMWPTLTSFSTSVILMPLKSTGKFLMNSMRRSLLKSTPKSNFSDSYFQWYKHGSHADFTSCVFSSWYMHDFGILFKGKPHGKGSVSYLWGSY